MLLTPVAMICNLAEKVDKCLLNRGHWVLFTYDWDLESCPLYRVAGCPLFRGCLSIEVNGRTVGTFRIARYIVGVRCWGVSVKRGSTVVVSREERYFFWSCRSASHLGELVGLAYVISCQDYFMSWHNDIRYIVAALHCTWSYSGKPLIQILTCLIS